MKDFIKIMKALSDPTRIKIVKMLQHKTMCVCEIRAALQIAQPSVSKHLKILEGENILRHKEFGRIRLYRLDEHSPKARALQKLMEVWEHANKYKTI